MVIITKLVFI